LDNMHRQAANPLIRASFSSQDTHSLAIIGHLAMDTIVHSDFKLDKSPGGSTAAIATAASQLGIDCSIQSEVGRDFPSEWLSVLDNLGIDLSQVDIAEKGESLHVTMNYDDKRKLVKIQCNDKVNDLVKIRAMPRTEAVHICPAKPDNQAELVKKLTDRGEILSVNFSEYFLKDLMKKDFLKTFPWNALNCAFLNRKEAKAVTGLDDPKEMASSIQAEGVDVIVITLGEEGSLVFDGDTLHRMEARDVEVVDPTGCGDSFVGGFLGEYLKSKDIKRSAGMGTYLASLTAQKKGSWAALMTDVGVRF
jgi:sugar/nucleoside kinase (ribokinase family)